MEFYRLQPEETQCWFNSMRNYANGEVKRPWIVATGVVVASLKIAKDLRTLGATVLAIGISRGTGSLENEDKSIQLLDLGMGDVPDMMDASGWKNKPLEIYQTR